MDVCDTEIANGKACETRKIEEDGEGKSGMEEATRYEGHST